MEEKPEAQELVAPESFLGVDVVDTAIKSILSKPDNREAAKKAKVRLDFYASLLNRINISGGTANLITEYEKASKIPLSTFEKETVTKDLKDLPGTLSKISKFIGDKL